MKLIYKVENIKDLGITMSSNCNFNQHISGSGSGSLISRIL